MHFLIPSLSSFPSQIGKRARRSRNSRRLRLAFFGCEGDPRSGPFCMEGLLDVRQGLYGVKWRSESEINTILGFAAWD